MMPGRIPTLYNICQVLLVGEGSLMKELLAELGEAEVVDIGSCKVLRALNPRRVLSTLSAKTLSDLR
jgi:hypothetical protein